MKSIKLREIDDQTYAAIKKYSEKVHLSINKSILQLIRNELGIKSKKRNTDFVEFIGTWTEKEAEEFNRSVMECRTIDKEMWE